MPIIKVYATKEEAKTIQAYAQADHRSQSNSLLHAFAGHVSRNKKKGQEGETITWPKKTPQSHGANTRKGEDRHANT